MASSRIQFCLIITFIISAKCVINGVGFPVETFQPEDLEGNQESTCVEMLTKFKSKLNELTQEMETLIKVEEEELGSGIYSSQEIKGTKSLLADLTHILEILLNNEMEGYGSASGSIPSQKENNEGSSSNCNPQFISGVESWLTYLNLQVQAVINNEMEGSVSASGSIPSQASKATVDPTEDPLTDQVCPNGWAHHGHSCFHIIDTPTPKWKKARSMCQRLGGDLGKITTASENQFIYDLLRKQKTVTDYGVWLGLQRKKDQQFYWVDDTPLSSYTAWGQGEPNDSAAHGGEDCVHKIGEKRSWPFQPGQWNDVPCSLDGIVPSYNTPVVLCQKKIDMDVLSF